MTIVKLGDKIRFRPTAWSEAGKAAGIDGLRWKPLKDVIGTVTYINEAHRYYRVEYTLETMWGAVWTDHECFKIPPPPSKDDPPELFRGHYCGHHKGPRKKKENTT